MLHRRRFLGLGLGALAGACTRGPGTTTREPVHQGPVDRIVLGRVLTLNPARPEAEAIGIAGGRIVVVGSTREVMERRELDATKLVLPGDPHHRQLRFRIAE